MVKTEASKYLSSNNNKLLLRLKTFLNICNYVDSTYNKSDIVTLGSSIYKSEKNNNTTNPNTSNFWTKIL